MTNTLTKLLLLFVVLITSAQYGHAFTEEVATDAELYTAISNFNSETSGSHTINFTADITISSSQGVTKISNSNGAGLIINGNGYELNGTNVTNRRPGFIVENNLSSVEINDLAIVETSRGLHMSSGSNIVTINRCLFDSNETLEHNGSGAAIVVNSGTLNINDSTFSNNIENKFDGGAISISVGAAATIQRSTFSNNRANGLIEGIGGLGGAIHSYGTLIVRQSTFVANFADIGGGAIRTAGDGAAEIYNTTFSGNEVSPGSSGANLLASTGALTLQNTIFEGGECREYISSSKFTDLGNNLFELTGNQACNLEDGVNGNITGTDPKLLPLASNGGPTDTMALATDSPAVDQGGTVTGGLTTDQRGVPSTLNTPDIGAFELLQPDQFESNDTGATATQLNTSLEQTELTIDEVNTPDEDVFTFHLDVGAEITIHVYFKHIIGDLDIGLFDDEALTNNVGFSNSTTDDEQISYTATQSRTYYLRIYGYFNAVNSYQLAVRLPNNQICFPVKARNGNIVMICL